MTERLDYLNAYRQQFDAQVLAIEDRAGVRYRVVRPGERVQPEF